VISKGTANIDVGRTTAVCWKKQKITNITWKKQAGNEGLIVSQEENVEGCL